MDGPGCGDERAGPRYSHVETRRCALLQRRRPGAHPQHSDRIQTPGPQLMKRSSERILTTHVGSLIRPPRLLDLVCAKESDYAAGARAYDQCLKESVAEVVRRQIEAGIDVVNDGEFGKSTSWSLYALKRVSGFEQRPVKPGANPFARGADRERFKEFYAELEGHNDPTWSNVTQTEAVCVAPVKYI